MPSDRRRQRFRHSRCTSVQGGRPTLRLESTRRGRMRRAAQRGSWAQRPPSSPASHAGCRRARPAGCEGWLSGWHDPARGSRRALRASQLGPLACGSGRAACAASPVVPWLSLRRLAARHHAWPSPRASARLYACGGGTAGRADSLPRPAGSSPRSAPRGPIGFEQRQRPARIAGSASLRSLPSIRAPASPGRPEQALVSSGCSTRALPCLPSGRSSGAGRSVCPPHPGARQRRQGYTSPASEHGSPARRGLAAIHQQARLGFPPTSPDVGRLGSPHLTSGF